MAARRALVAGNWKMNGMRANLAEVAAVRDGIARINSDVALCPPATLIAEMAALAAGSALIVGGQDCHADDAGAHTGDISAKMIADAGGRLVIVGHSERRANHGETNAVVRAKTEAVWRAGLLAILCIGETETDRRSGATLEVLADQIAGSVPEGGNRDNLVVAYEPVWAIGTGLTPSEGDIAEAHAHIRDKLAGICGREAESIRVLYGGSVKASNAATILSLDDVDGALVGGASLKAEDFLGITAVLK